MLNDEFPKISFAYVNISDAKELAAQNSVFQFQQSNSFFDGQELLRKSGNINLSELAFKLERSNSLCFDLE